MLRCALWLCALGVFPAAVQARTGSDYAYPKAHAWSTLVRLVRVDFGYAISEKDPKNGYVLFGYRDGSRSYPGSVELLPSRRYGARGVRVMIHVPAMPRYVERMMLDRLERKLREELGDPLQDERDALLQSPQQDPNVRAPTAEPGSKYPKGRKTVPNRISEVD